MPRTDVSRSEPTPPARHQVIRPADRSGHGLSKGVWVRCHPPLAGRGRRPSGTPLGAGSRRRTDERIGASFGPRVVGVEEGRMILPERLGRGAVCSDCDQARDFWGLVEPRPPRPDAGRRAHHHRARGLAPVQPVARVRRMDGVPARRARGADRRHTHPDTRGEPLASVWWASRLPADAVRCSRAAGPSQDWVLLGEAGRSTGEAETGGVLHRSRGPGYVVFDEETLELC